MSNPLKELEKFGQSPWIDMISREMLDSGTLARLVEEDGAKGLTSNPSIFEKAIAQSADYDNTLAHAIGHGVSDPKTLFEVLAIKDIRDAADLLKPVYDASGGADGFVSLEVSPRLAYDSAGTIAEAERLFRQVDRKNLMIKIPATAECLPAIAAVIAKGINVNVTLIFSLKRYRKVMDAYLEGLEALGKSGKPLSAVASVASFFVSRLDSAIDKATPEDSPVRGKVAVANAKLAYQDYLTVFSSPRFEKLKAKGAHVQRPLWASTSTKNPAYGDVLYVEELIGKDTVNTIPPDTWDAFRDHGKTAETLTADVEGAEKTIAQLDGAGVDLDAVTDKLEKDGVDAFIRSFESLLDSIRKKSGRLRGEKIDSAEKKTADDLDPADVVERIWKKDAALWKEDSSHKAVIDKSLGWLRMPRVMPDRLQELEAFAREVAEAGFENAVVLGMGGSSLAPLVFRSSLPSSAPGVDVSVLDSTEPETVKSVEEAADPEHTLYIVASKSGTTVEPMRFFDYFYGLLKAKMGPEAGRHFIAITDPGSRLVQTAQEHGFRKVFLNFEDIGGRFSALSYFGIVPAALNAPQNVKKLLERAHKMADACALKTPDNPGFALGKKLGEHARAGRDKIHFLLPARLAGFGLWVEQLLAESTGKEGLGVVPVAGEPPPEPERCGEDKVFVLLKLKDEPNERLDASAKKLAKRGHPVLTYELNDAYDLGAEMFRWEFATAVLGKVLGINPFDQPNVQAAKEKTVSLLMELKRSGELPKLDTHMEQGPLSMTFSASSPKDLARFLGDCRPGDYAGLLAYICSDGRYEAALNSLRAALNDALNLSVQAGYGPRYLHSTGQLHKGGADNGMFIVLSRADGPDLDIEGADYSFGQLVRAQALGDFQALAAAGRRAVFIRITGDVKTALSRLTDAVAAAAHTAMKV